MVVPNLMPSLAPPLSSAGAAGSELKTAETRPTVTVQSLNGLTDARFKFVSSNLSFSYRQGRQEKPSPGARWKLLWCSVPLLPRLRPDSALHPHSPKSESRWMQIEQGKNLTGAWFRTRNGICKTTPQSWSCIKHPLRTPGYLAIGYYLTRRRGTPFIGPACVLMRECAFWLPRIKPFQGFYFQETRRS